MAPLPRSPEKHAAILQAAISCFTERGFNATTIADIAEHAGIGKGTVYEYVNSKEELLLDACLHACRQAELAMNGIAGGAIVSDPEGGHSRGGPGMHPVKAAYLVLRSVLAVLLSVTPSENRMFADLLLVSQDKPELLVKARSELGRKLDGWVTSATALVRAGVEAGCFRHMPAEQERSISRIVVAAVDGLVWQRLWLEHDKPTEQVAHEIAAAWITLHLCEPERLTEFLA